MRCFHRSVRCRVCARVTNLALVDATAEPVALQEKINERRCVVDRWQRAVEAVLAEVENSDRRVVEQPRRGQSAGEVVRGEVDGVQRQQAQGLGESPVQAAVGELKVV